MRYSFLVQYVGKNYAGSQIQFRNSELIPIPTIQGELEKALCTLIYGTKKTSPIQQNNRPIKTIFSGRTDSGVNAIGQVVHFDLDKDIVASNFMYSLNEILPPDISVSNLKIVSPKFHAIKSAISRHYRYEFINRTYKYAFDGDLLRVKYDIDIERMQNSLNYIIGEHDFSSFKSSGTPNPGTVCLISKAECKRLENKIVIDIVGNRFLYNMIRAIVGTLLEIEGHNLAPSHIKEVMESKNRSKAGRNVCPYGLTLVEVSYN